MKKLLLFIIIAIGVVNISFSQPCLPGGIRFTTQAQVDSFPIIYPNCTEIEGRVEITGSDIASLDSLYSITSIDGILLVEFTEKLKNFSGLDNLEIIDDEISIYWNSGLEDFTGFANLTKVKNGISIQFNNSLISLTGLESLDSIGGVLYIWMNDSLQSLSGLEGINPNSIFDIYIAGNQMLSDCNSESICEYLSDPKGSVDIHNNDSGCNNPSEVADACGITLTCLPFGNYNFMNQVEIDSFYTNYEDCFEIEGNLNIHGTNISNLTGLLGIRSISGRLRICGCDSLINLHGLDSLTSIGWQLQIGHYECAGNWGLQSLEGLENLSDIGYALSIMNNIVLTDLNGLGDIGSVEMVDIGFNDALVSLDGLEGLDSVTQLFTLFWNETLSDITGLTNLNHLRSIYITGNDGLENLSGLENIDPISMTGLTIKRNSSLSECDVLSICEYLLDDSNNATIENNATGCNSEAEVEEACLVSIGQTEFSEHLTIYPNPFAISTTIKYQLDQPAQVTLTIFNHLGKQVDHIQEYQQPGKQSPTWQPQGLPPGMYYYTLHAGDHVVTGKMVMLK